jgi:hypothetical protein
VHPLRKLRLLIGLAAALAVPSFAAARAVAAGPCPPASDCPAPTVTTGPATHVTDTTATLTGTVNGNGAAVGYSFAYGPAGGDYGSTTPLAMLPPSSAPTTVSVAVTGLQPNAAYHFRLTAGSPTPAVGQEVIFKTRPRERERPSLTLQANPRHDTTLPYTFTFTGTLRPPGDVARQDGCAGTVTIQIKAGSKTISTRRARVRGDCGYKRGVTFKSRKRLRSRGTLKVTARYGGNQVLKPAGKTIHVRAGR